MMKWQTVVFGFVAFVAHGAARGMDETPLTLVVAGATALYMGTIIAKAAMFDKRRD